MAGRRNRSRRAKLEVEDSPAKTSSSSSSSSGGSIDRAAQRKILHSRLQRQPEEEEEEDEAWTESDRKAMRRDLLNFIHRYYIDAISRLPRAELRTTLARALLIAGHCFGPLQPVHNIIVNAIWYAAAAIPLPGPDDHWTDDVLLSTDGIARICYRSLEGLVASLRHCCPSLSTGDALCQLMYADADLASAIALANGTSKSSALQVMASRGLAAFHLAAQAAQHPNPATFAQFASSELPNVNAKHGVVQFLLINHVPSTADINHLSNVLVPELPHEAPQSPLMLSPQVLDWITSQKEQFKDTAKQVLNVVNMALQHYTLQTGKQLLLHSVCGVSLLNEEGLKNCYHINFLACHEDSGSVVGAPMLFFTEAILLARDETDIRLCVIVDAATDIGCCFACETNRKKIVHPTYDEYLGRQDFEEDEVDCGSNFASPLDVDYIYFDAGRDIAFANYLDDSIGCGDIASPEV